jgi:TRAP-type transport system periplasmic protein
MLCRLSLLGAFLVATTGLVPSAAAEVVTLKFEHFMPAVSQEHRTWLAPWAERIGTASGGRIKVEVYPSMQLGGKAPQLYDQTKDGVVDIAWVVAGYTPGRFPRLEVFELPWMASTEAAKTSPAIWDFFTTYAQDETKDVKVLAMFAHGKGTLFTKDKPVRLPADLAGLKIRVPTRTINTTLQLLGASPQGIPAPQVPEALAKGVVDGVMFPYEVVPAFKVDELTNHVTEFMGDRALYTAVFMLVMNKARYDALPADLKAIIDANSGAALSAEIGKDFDGWDLAGREAVAKHGALVTKIDGADLEAWKAATAGVAKGWIAERDKAGDKGAELVKAASDLIAKYAK